MVLRAAENLTALGCPLIGIVVNLLNAREGDEYAYGYGYGYVYGEELHDQNDVAPSVAPRNSDLRSWKKPSPEHAIASRSSRPGSRSGPRGLFVRGTDARLFASFSCSRADGRSLAWDHLLLGLLACWTALCWSLHQILSDRPKWRFSGAEPLFVMGLALLVLQVVSLPSSTLQSISPAIEKRLPMWTEGSDLGTWSTISLTPQDTLASLMTVASCMLLFFTAVQRFQRQKTFSGS